MILLGILLVAIALGGGALLFVGTSGLESTITVPVLGASVNLPPLALFVAGAVAVLLLWMGWALLRGGARRSARQRREAKENARLAEEQRRRSVDTAEQPRREEYDRAATERGSADRRVPERSVADDSAARRGEVADERSPGARG
jgi:membrane protein implicated in regulation of membrane protease activity